MKRCADTAAAAFHLLDVWRKSSKRAGPQRRADGARHIALLAWAFAPSISGGVYRPASLARYATRAGWRVTVIAGPSESESDAGTALLDYVGKGVRILRVPESATRIIPSYRLFPSIDKSLVYALDMFDVAYRMLAVDRPEVVVATGPPFHAFVAGYFIKRWTSAKLVLDYRDEWTQCPFDFVEKGGSNERWERRCLAAADSVILTTVSQRERLKSVYAEVAEKSAVIPNGWEPEDFAVADFEPAKHPSRPVTLLFAGKLGGHTDPDPFLRTLRRLFDHKPEWLGAVKVRFVGQKTNAALEALRAFPFQQAIDIVDAVPKREIASYMRSCDALLLLHDRRFERYLPGKLYDYLASDKPILVIDDGGETRRLIETLQAGWAIDSSDVQALNDVISMLRNRTSPASPARLQWMARHTREKLAGQFLDRIAASR